MALEKLLLPTEMRPPMAYFYNPVPQEQRFTSSGKDLYDFLLDHLEEGRGLRPRSNPSPQELLFTSSGQELHDFLLDQLGGKKAIRSI